MSQRRAVETARGVRGRRAWSFRHAGLCLVLAWGAGMIAASAAQTQTPPAENQVSDLTTRYRFIERYAAASGGQAAEIGQYRVANRDVLKVETEKEQGAPDRRETTVQVIYTERAATVNSSAAVTGLVRHYDAYRVTPQAETKPSVPTPLENLSVWIAPRPSASPVVLGLTDNHPMTEIEYTISTKYLILMPELSSVLPALPSRIGDRWTVPRGAGQALMGDRPVSEGRPLVAELTDVRRATDRPEFVASIRVTGSAKLPPNGSDTLINALILFKFAPPAPAPAPGAGAEAPAGGVASGPTVVDARGAITDVRLARTSTSAVTGGNGRLRRTLTWELTLQRDLARPGAPLSVPPKAPAPTQANSWLTYDDPQGRFHFRYPQELHPKKEPEAIELGIVELTDERPNSLDGRIVRMMLQTKSGDPKADRDNRDPEFHKKSLNEEWARNKRDVLRGPTGWLPEATWAPFKMKVYRIEAAEKPSGPASRDVARIFLDHYLILFAQDESLMIEAITGQDPTQGFRKQVEEILKTFALGPATGPRD